MAAVTRLDPASASSRRNARHAWASSGEGTKASASKQKAPLPSMSSRAQEQAFPYISFKALATCGFDDRAIAATQDPGAWARVGPGNASGQPGAFGADVRQRLIHTHFASTAPGVAPWPISCQELRAIRHAGLGVGEGLLRRPALPLTLWSGTRPGDLSTGTVARTRRGHGIEL